MIGPTCDQELEPDLAAFALSYGASGRPVFPLHTPTEEGGCSCRRDCGRGFGKHPRTLHGVSDATTDAGRIRKWWSTWPVANIGIATGAISELFALDVDEATGGWESLDALQAKYGHLPETPAVLTGSHGVHLYFRHPGQRVPNSAGKLGPGLDVRGDGGFVVAPPSLHRTGRRYAWDTDWHPDRIPFAEAPAWLLDMIITPNVATTAAIPSVEGELIPEGQRNTVLASLAGTMRRRGFTEGAILAALLAENEARCRPPLPEAEVATIARSIARYAPTAQPSRSTWRGLRVREVRRA
jgi:Bifunctional DNA primase/polymerase, N-terminal/Primase C terminal 1 (PriCT-1)